MSELHKSPTSARAYKLRYSRFCRASLHAATRSRSDLTSLPNTSIQITGLTGACQLQHSYFCTSCRASLHAATRSYLLNFTNLQPQVLLERASFRTNTSTGRLYTRLYEVERLNFTNLQPQDLLERDSFKTNTSDRSAGRLCTQLQKSNE